MNEKEKKKVEWLSRCVWIDAKIKQCKEQIEELEASMDGLKAQNFDGMPKSSSGGFRSDDKIIELSEKIEKFWKKIIILKLEEIDKRDEIFDAINQVKDPRAQVLLGYRYLDGLKWEEICVKMNYTWQWVHKLHIKALKEIEIVDFN